MSRPRKPTALLELAGAFDHDPQRARARANEPKPSGELGNPPKYFSKDEKKIWRELQDIIPNGVLGNCDRFTVELVCFLMAKLRNRSIRPQESSQLLTCLGKLGMNPADRSKVTAHQSEDKPNEFAEYTEPTNETQQGSWKVC